MCWIARNKRKLLNRGAESKVHQCSGDKWDKLSAYWSEIQTQGKLTALVRGPDPLCFLVGMRAAARRTAHRGPRHDSTALSIFAMTGGKARKVQVTAAHAPGVAEHVFKHSMLEDCRICHVSRTPLQWIEPPVMSTAELCQGTFMLPWCFPHLEIAWIA